MRREIGDGGSNRTYVSVATHCTTYDQGACGTTSRRHKVTTHHRISTTALASVDDVHARLGRLCILIGTSLSPYIALKGGGGNPPLPKSR